MLEQNYNQDDCRSACSRMSEYIDSSLPARDMWEIEKHLALCHKCAEHAQTMQLTLEALKGAPLCDTSNSFMAGLHARLDELGPVPARPKFGFSIRSWFAAARLQLNTKPVPTLSLGMATLFVAAVLFAVKPGGQGTAPVVVAPEPVSQEALARNVAVTASNPFDDPVAAKLEAEVGSLEQPVKAGND